MTGSMACHRSTRPNEIQALSVVDLCNSRRRPRWCNEADTSTEGRWTLRTSQVPSQWRIGVALGLEKKQDPGSLQGPGPDHAAPRSPRRTTILHH
jgi:hypothetical protein